MAEQIQQTRTTVPDDTVATTANPNVAEREHRKTVAERVVWYITSLLLALLAIRFIFALLGANPNNGIADFVYSVSHPFVAPFFNLFGYGNLVAGKSRFEVYTLVAMAVYALIGYGIAKLFTLTSRRHTSYA
jgi:cation transport ATPase